jgi:hypothetical protein
MAVEGIGGNGSTGVAFLVSAGLVAELIAKACSSPQTLEINAGRRVETLWKWVNIGMAEAVVFVVIAALIDRKHQRPILLGAMLEMGITYLEYVHGKQSGLAAHAAGALGTETY